MEVPLVTILDDTAGNNPTLNIENQNDDANSAVLEFYKNSASPADNDDLGAVDFYGEDSGSNKTRFAYILSESLDVTDGDEGGGMRFEVLMDASSSLGARPSGPNASAQPPAPAIRSLGSRRLP